jgi:hypothetical protein
MATLEFFLSILKYTFSSTAVIWFFSWLMQQLMRPRIDISIQYDWERRNNKKICVSQILLQNQQQCDILGPIQIEIPSKTEWYKDEKIDAVSIIHGPVEAPPKVEFLNNDCQITVERGMRSLVTWLIICRTQYQPPLKMKLRFEKNLKEVRLEKGSSIDQDKLYGMTNTLGLVVFGSIFFGLSMFVVGVFDNVADFFAEDNFGMSRFWGILGGIIFVWAYSAAVFYICRLKSPSLILGYTEESDLLGLSTTRSSP